MTGDQDSEDKSQPAIPLNKDIMVGHYRVIEKIGAGGMGEVYLAEDTLLARKIALKFLPIHLCQDEECRKRFKRESQAAAKLDHPNIVTIYEVSEFHGRPYIAMQYVSQTSLDAYLLTKERSLNEIIDIARDLCKGLLAAHQAGIIHRDVKPANIILDESSHAKIVDFGLAYVIGASNLTDSGSTMGTLEYMSPEQIEGKKIDGRSDIFSVGVILYEMITGRRPFTGEYVQSVQYSILNDTPEPLARYKSNVPDQLQEIVDKALEKDPGLRYQNIADMLTDLRRLVHKSDDSIKRLRRRKRKRFQVICSIVIICLVLGTALMLKFRPGKTKYTHVAILPIKNLANTSVSQAFCDGLLESMASKLTQLQQYMPSLMVIPTNEILNDKVTSVSQARKALGATLVITGSLQEFGNESRLSLNLVDAKSGRQLQSTVLDNIDTDQLKFQDSVIFLIADMLGTEVSTEESKYLMSGGTRLAEAYKAYIEGQGYLRRELSNLNIDSAINLFSEALKFDSNYALAYAGLGESYWWKYELSKNTKWTELAIYNALTGKSLDTTLSPVYYTLGLISAGMNRYPDAIRNFKRAWELDRTDVNSLRQIGRAYASMGRSEDAEYWFLKALDYKPMFWKVYDDLVQLYATTGRLPDAIILIERIVEVDPDGFANWNNIGALYLMVGKQLEAINAFKRSLDIEPNYGAYSNLGAIYYLQTNYLEAAQMYEKALNITDTDYSVWYNLAEAYRMIPGSNEDINRAYNKALQLAEQLRNFRPNDNRLLSHIIDCYIGLGKTEQARRLLTELASSRIDEAEVMLTIGLLYVKLGDIDKGYTWVERALRSGYPISYIENVPEMQILLKDSIYGEKLKNL